MSQITIRGMDPKVEQRIRELSKKKGKSLNKVIIEMIEKDGRIDSKSKQIPSESLKDLAGGWTEQDASEFFESIKFCEQIDEGLWS